jgi:hypothetical protein
MKIIRAPEVSRLSEPGQTGEMAMSDWYAAHLIEYFKYREGRQRSFLHGTEVSYTEMVLPSEKAVHQLAAGKSVNVRIEDVPVGEPRRRIAE